MPKNIFHAFIKTKDINSTKNSDKNSFFHTIIDKNALSKELKASKVSSKTRTSNSKNTKKRVT